MSLRSLSDELRLRALRRSMRRIAARLQEVARPLTPVRPLEPVALRVLPGGLRRRR